MTSTAKLTGSLTFDAWIQQPAISVFQRDSTPLNQPTTLLPQARQGSDNHPPDQHMVSGAVLMGQLVAKADDAWPCVNAGKQGRIDT